MDIGSTAVKSQQNDGTCGLDFGQADMIRGVLESMNQGLLVIDNELRIRATNQKFYVLNELNTDEAPINSNFTDYLRLLGRRGDFGNRDIEEVIAERIAMITSLKPHAFERKRPSGTYLRVTFTPYGEKLSIQTYTDITDLKLSEIQLREREEALSQLMQVSSDWFWEMDENLRFSFMSSTVRDATGLAAEEFLGKTRWEVAGIDPMESPIWRAHYEDLMAHRPFREFTYRSKTSIPRVLSLTGIPVFDSDGRFKGYRGSGKDITRETEQNEEEARLTEVLETTLEHMIDGISIVDSELNVQAFNSRMLEMLDLPADMFSFGDPLEKFFTFNAERGDYGPGDPAQLVRERLELAARFVPHEFERQRPDGTVVLIRGNPLGNGGMVTTYTDITARKKAAAHMQKLSAAVEGSASLIVITDSDGRIEFVNEALEKATGYAAHELVGKKPSIWRSEGTPPETYKQIWDTILSGKPWVGELENRRRDGSAFWVSTTITPIASDDGELTHFLSVQEDITELKQRRFKEVQSDKLAAFAEMVTGIAHELNQPLNIIRMASDSLNEAIQDDQTLSPHKVSQKLSRISDQAARASVLIEQMRVLEQTSNSESESIGVRELIEAASRIVTSAATPSSVKYTVNIPATCRPVFGPLSDLENALEGIIENAFQFTPENGTVKIDVIDEAGTNDIGIRIWNSGSAIPDQNLPIIFDPFFTTKEIGKGTGLSLAMTYRIVKAVGGAIDVSNEDGGVAFSVRLPSTPET